MALIPKGCIVHAAEIQPKGVEVRYRCGDGQSQYEYTDRSGYKTISTYPEPKFVKGARGIRFRGMTVTGTGSRVDFVLSPAHAVCKTGRSGARKEVVCRLKGDTSSESLRGLRGKRRRRGLGNVEFPAPRRFKIKLSGLRRRRSRR